MAARNLEGMKGHSDGSARGDDGDRDQQLMWVKAETETDVDDVPEHSEGVGCGHNTMAGSGGGPPTTMVE